VGRLPAALDVGVIRIVGERDRFRGFHAVFSRVLLVTPLEFVDAVEQLRIVQLLGQSVHPPPPDERLVPVISGRRAVGFDPRDTQTGQVAQVLPRGVRCAVRPVGDRVHPCRLTERQ
jgi:hypothetical protein